MRLPGHSPAAPGRELERAARSVEYNEDDELTPAREAELNARILAAVQAKLEEQAPAPDLDPVASAAFLTYLRAKGREHVAEKRALEELLGRATTCPSPVRVFHAEISEQNELRLASIGDPKPLIRHFCRAGCRSVSWYPAD